MRIALALTSALSMAALAQPAPATSPPAPTPPPAAAAPAPKPAEATEAKPPAPATAQPATPPATEVKPTTTAQPTPPPPAKPEAPAATAQPAATPAAKPEAPPATAQPAPAAPSPKPEATPATAQPATPPAVPATATTRTPAAVVPARGSAGLTLPVGPPPQDTIRARAKEYFHALKQADAREMIVLSGFPFYLENQRFDQPDLLLQEWTKHLRAKRTDLLTLYGVDVYTLAEMEQKYGKPPARLKDVPLRGSVFIAVANLSGHAALLVFRDDGEGWRAIAYSD